MKIWIAELILIYNDENEWEPIFRFELSYKEYELDEDTNSYRYCRGCLDDRVPVNMELRRTCIGTFKVWQGFNRELSKEELKELEGKMKDLLLKGLGMEKNEYLKTYENKVKSIRGKK